MNLEQALDHADLVGDCVSTSAKALKALADAVRKWQVRDKELDKAYSDGYADGLHEAWSQYE